jgi:DNA-binding response OmpR family regulator
MQKLLLLYQTEGGSFLQRDFAAFDYEVQLSPLSSADEAMTVPGIDAIVLEAAGSFDETRRVLESPARPQRIPILLIVRPDQLGVIDATLSVDDFALLPAAGEELAVRLRRALWRRNGVDSENTLHAGELLLDLANYKVFVGGQPVSLTFKEFELLRFLMTNRGKVFTREALLNRVWGYEYFGGARTVDVHVRRLRSKIETSSTVYVETVRNVGYRFPADT